jgi:hypothetical protein
MPFFHVIAAFDQEPEKQLAIFMDLSESELKSRFLKPYARAQDLVSGNQIFAVRSLRKIHIIRTERESAAELSDLQRKSREEVEEINRRSEHVVFIALGEGHEQQDIVHTGTDVTAQLIIGPPGAKGKVAALASLFNNGWVVGVGGGMVVTALAWWH